MIQATLSALRLPDLRNKILFTLGMLIIFRVVAHIPLPNVDLNLLRQRFEGDQLLGFLNLLSGGALENFSVVALGVYPYITASIIFNILVPIVPQLRELSREGGDAGRRKLAFYTRLFTVPLAMMQGYAQIQILRAAAPSPIGDLPVLTILGMLVILAGGTMFLYWLGELITERGIGNGVSIIILGGIVAGVPPALGQSLLGGEAFTGLIAFAVIGVLMVSAIVFVHEGQRRIPVSYAKRVRGNRIYGGRSTHIPMKINSAGMIPLIFAFSIMLMPATIAQYAATSDSLWLAEFSGVLAGWFGPEAFPYWFMTFLLVVAFTFFYTIVIFNQQNLPENLQKNGGFIPGIRPGRPTAAFLNRVLNRITLAGGIFLGLIAIVPFFVGLGTGVTAVALSSTGLLITVGVVLDTMRQLESQLMMREYEAFL